MSIGENVKFYREQRHLSLEQFAQQLGLKPVDCEGIESGRRMLSSSDIQRICKILGVSLESLLCKPAPKEETETEGSILMPVDELQNLLGKMKE